MAQNKIIGHLNINDTGIDFDTSTGLTPEDIDELKKIDFTNSWLYREEI
jgi:hypothetical protein